VTCPHCGLWMVRDKHLEYALPYMVCQCGKTVWLTDTGEVYQPPEVGGVFLPRQGKHYDQKGQKGQKGRTAD